MNVYVAKTWKRNRENKYRYHKSAECALSGINNSRASRGIEPIPEADYRKKLDFYDIGYYKHMGLVPCKKCCKGGKK